MEYFLSQLPTCLCSWWGALKRKETEPVKKVKVMNAPEVMSVKFLVEEIRLEDFVVFDGVK